MESSFNYWKASTLGPHWDHFVLAKHVFKQSSGERHSAETEQHCETNMHSKAARETKSDYWKYIQTIQMAHATPILRQWTPGCKARGYLGSGSYGHDSDPYCIESSSPHVKRGSIVYQTALKDRCLTLKKVHNTYCKQVHIWLRVVQLL